jgi:hypothetical protein
MGDPNTSNWYNTVVFNPQCDWILYLFNFLPALQSRSQAAAVERFHKN